MVLKLEAMKKLAKDHRPSMVTKLEEQIDQRIRQEALNGKVGHTIFYIPESVTHEEVKELAEKYRKAGWVVGFDSEDFWLKPEHSL